METVEDEGQRVLKKQRLSADQIDRHLDELLTHVEKTKQRLMKRQEEVYRKKNNYRPSGSPPVRTTDCRELTQNEVTQTSDSTSAERSRALEKSDLESKDAETIGLQNNETESIIRDFVERVQRLNVDKNVASELKSMHVLLSKYSKHIDKNLCTDIAKVCRTQDFDEKLVSRLVAEHLYQDGQINAADVLCKEAKLELLPAYRDCYVELHRILKAITMHDVQPALEWARQNRKALRLMDIDIEFQLVRLKYVDILETSPDMMDAVGFANRELSLFHQTHAEEVGVLMSCLLYKGKLDESPYRNLFSDSRWTEINDAVIQACCRLRRVPHRSYLETCLSAGVSALPAMRKLVSVMGSKLADWDSMEELPVEIPVAKELRFHSVFSCPVSKEESTSENPPMLLKCGHVICRSCVNRFSFHKTRRFKCPTCPVEQTESETRTLFF
ncbi:unnamed protein product [Hyaloperonospora brassicae]|uniref:RING-type domain-containing protein n=1 Tax=Hyaloperonospora brassicae TaxID=162125 RepID=A0AAV0UFN2_HYABA|nr:unnamed protein product [Hyaloperonospora brassicae]